MKAAAETFTRAQCRSRSGVTPSKARAPSNTMEPSQTAWVRGPMIGALPACQSPSKKVQVFETSAGLNGASAGCSDGASSSPLVFSNMFAILAVGQTTPGAGSVASARYLRGMVGMNDCRRAFCAARYDSQLA
jgi:hypothetical protein